MLSVLYLKLLADCHIANDVHDALATAFDDHHVLPDQGAPVTKHLTSRRYQSR
jgi:hypothetical protein